MKTEEVASLRIIGSKLQESKTVSNNAAVRTRLQAPRSDRPHHTPLSTGNCNLKGRNDVGPERGKILLQGNPGTCPNYHRPPIKVAYNCILSIQSNMNPHSAESR